MNSIIIKAIFTGLLCVLIYEFIPEYLNLMFIFTPDIFGLLSIVLIIFIGKIIVKSFELIDKIKL